MRGDVMSTNIVATTLYWNVIGSLVGLFLFLFDGILPVMMQDGEGSKTVRILWWSSISSWVPWGLFVVAMLTLLPAQIAATAIHHMPASWSAPNPFYAALYWILPVALGILLMWVVTSQQSNPEVYVQTGDQQADPHPIRRSLVYWTGYAMAAPFVANAMNMLLQRRDWLLNEAAFLSVLAAALCPLAIEMMQRFFAYLMSQEMSPDTEQDVYNYVLLNRGKNMMIKIVMVTTAFVVLLLSLTTLPVFPSTGFSNAYYTVLVASAVLALPLISPARHLTHVSAAVVFCLLICLKRFGLC